MKDVKVLWADGKRDLALRICQNAPGGACSASVVKRLENTFWIQYERDGSGKVGLYELAKEINFPWRKPFERTKPEDGETGALVFTRTVIRRSPLGMEVARRKVSV